MNRLLFYKPSPAVTWLTVHRWLSVPGHAWFAGDRWKNFLFFCSFKGFVLSRSLTEFAVIFFDYIKIMNKFDLTNYQLLGKPVSRQTRSQSISKIGWKNEKKNEKLQNNSATLQCKTNKSKQSTALTPNMSKAQTRLQHPNTQTHFVQNKRHAKKQEAMEKGLHNLKGYCRRLLGNRTETRWRLPVCNACLIFVVDIS